MNPAAASPAAAASPETMVLDTQIVLDWLVFRDPSVASLARAVECGSLRWLTTRAMLEELERVLDRGVGAARQPDRARISQTCRRLATITAPAPPAGSAWHCIDPDDQIFIDLALAGRARWLFTRDRALLRLARRAAACGVCIVPPAAWHPPETAGPR